MTGAEVFAKTKEEANKNSGTDNLEVDDPRIYWAVNEAQNKYLTAILDRQADDEIRNVQKFLVPFYPLKFSKKDKISEYFTLPDNLFDFSNIIATVKNGSCKSRIDLNEGKNANYHILIGDDNNKPSWYYRESFYVLTSDFVRIFTLNEFEVDEVNIDYYRYPRKIDVEGYININNQQSSNSDPEWSDKEMDRIIDIAVKDYIISSENYQALQPNLIKIQNKV